MSVHTDIELSRGDSTTTARISSCRYIRHYYHVVSYTGDTTASTRTKPGAQYGSAYSDFYDDMLQVFCEGS